MKTLIVAAIVSLVIVRVATAADTIVQIADRTFTNATITSDGVRVKVISSTGIETFPLARMSPEDQARWGYKPAAAATQAKRDAAADAALHESFAKQQAAIDAANSQQAAQTAADEAKAKALEATKKPVQLKPGAGGAGYGNELHNAVGLTSPF